MRTVISLDPGGQTGICRAVRSSSGEYDIDYLSHLRKQELYAVLEVMIPKADFLIYETYRLYESKAKAMIGNEFETVQIIGVIRYLCEKHGVPHKDSPTTNKAFFNNDRLKALGLYSPVEHRRDAIRHFLYWYYFTSGYGNKKDLLVNKGLEANDG